MKKLLLLLAVVLSSCGSRVDRVFDMYLRYQYGEITKVEFKQSASFLSFDDLEELNRRIKEYKGAQVKIENENLAKQVMIDDMLKDK